MNNEKKYKLALGLGIASVPLAFLFYIAALPLSIIGIVLSIILLKEKKKNFLVPFIFSLIGFLLSLTIAIMQEYAWLLHR